MIVRLIVLINLSLSVFGGSAFAQQPPTLGERSLRFAQELNFSRIEFGINGREIWFLRGLDRNESAQRGQSTGRAEIYDSSSRHWMSFPPKGEDSLLYSVAFGKDLICACLVSASGEGRNGIFVRRAGETEWKRVEPKAPRLIPDQLELLSVSPDQSVLWGSCARGVVQVDLTTGSVRQYFDDPTRVHPQASKGPSISNPVDVMKYLDRDRVCFITADNDFWGAAILNLRTGALHSRLLFPDLSREWEVSQDGTLWMYSHSLGYRVDKKGLEQALDLMIEDVSIIANTQTPHYTWITGRQAVAVKKKTADPRLPARWTVFSGDSWPDRPPPLVVTPDSRFALAAHAQGLAVFAIDGTAMDTLKIIPPEKGRTLKCVRIVPIRKSSRFLCVINSTDGADYAETGIYVVNPAEKTFSMKFHTRARVLAIREHGLGRFWVSLPGVIYDLNTGKGAVTLQHRIKLD